MSKTMKTILITGASSGIGAEAVKSLLGGGNTVYAGARRVDRMQSLANAGARLLALDVTDDASMTAAVKTILQRTGRIDVLVNNAGYGSYGALEDVPLEEGRRQFDVNIFGLARLTQLVLPTMRAQRSGRIINISSIGGKIGEPFGCWYHATKFAVEGLSDPKAYDVFYFYGRCVFAQGKYEKAAALFRRASELDPGDFQSLNHLEMCLRALGRVEEARHESAEQVVRVERHVLIHPTDARALYLGAGALLQLGDRERCLEWCARAVAVDPDENVTLYNVVCSYALMGEKDQALTLLETVVSGGFGHKDWVENDPDFASLRDHPRFAALLKQLAARRS